MDKSRRYARPEYERRFLLDAIPTDAADPRHITDRFLTGTRLRLRTVHDGATGEVLETKLGHKVRPDPADATTVLCTSLYLEPGEVEALLALEAVEVAKTRHRWSHDGHPIAVDSYDGHLAGLVVAELNFADPEQLAGYEPPPPLGPEITGVEALTGPNLARVTGSYRKLALAVPE